MSLGKVKNCLCAYQKKNNNKKNSLFAAPGVIKVFSRPQELKCSTQALEYYSALHYHMLLFTNK